jgi:hypothetical protein
VANGRFIKSHGFIANICELWKQKKISSDSAIAMITQNMDAFSKGYWHDEDDEPWRPRQEGSVRLVGRARTLGRGEVEFTFMSLSMPAYRGLIVFADQDTLSRRTFTLRDINTRQQGFIDISPGQRFSNPWVLSVESQQVFEALTLERVRDIVRKM